MAKKGKSRYAVLGMLALADMSGYDIKRHFERCLGSVWTESYGKIYPALKELLDEEHVRSQTHRQAGRPDRVVYSLTASGERELAAWLEEPAETETVRHEDILKVLFGHATRPERTQAHLRSFIERRQAKMAEAQEFKRFTELTSQGSPQEPYMLSVADYVLAVNEASARWAEQALRQLDRAPAAGPARAPAKRAAKPAARTRK